MKPCHGVGATPEGPGAWAGLTLLVPRPFVLPRKKQPVNEAH